MIVQNEDERYLWIVCPNPDHKDTHASLIINKIDLGKYPKGYGYCFGCGHTITFSAKAVDKMSKKKSICRKKKPINWYSLMIKHHLNSEVVCKSAKLSELWNINPCVLMTYNIGYDGEALTIPMLDENEEIIGISRRFPDGSKSCVEGSQLGLFITKIRGHKVVITEGFSDAAVATHLGFVGIGKPCASFGEHIVRKYLENIGYDKEVIIVQDNDEAGQRSSIKLQSVLQNWELKIVNPWPFNDLKEYYLENDELGHGFDKTVCLLEN